ncbi:sulfotransferase family protein [Hyella patelloides]|nr:sulfotransferase domain-containing protein [Hyella patelloides]
MPNFLIIGAAKSGTTSINAYLKQHPQIYMSPQKEPNFFAFEGEQLDFLGSIAEGYRQGIQTDLETYQRNFQAVSHEIAIGETSPSYLYIEKAAERIKYHLPQVKLIAIVRDPSERAYSNFLHHCRDRLELYQDFETALEAEESRITNNWWWGFHYVNVSRYFLQLKRYFEIFDRDQIKVYLYEDLQDNPLQLSQDIFQFLGVDSQFVPDMSAKYNTTGIPKYQTLDALIKEQNLIKTVYQFLIPTKLRKQITANLSQRNSLVKPTLTPELRQKLQNRLKEDILQLQDLIKRDLSNWLK